MHSTITSFTQRRGVRQFLKFGIVGASGTLVNLVVFTVLQRLDPQHALASHYYVLFSIAFMTGGVSNYWLNRVWTFRSSGHAVREGAQFLTVSAIALAVSLVVGSIVGHVTGHYGHLAWLISTAAGIFVNFFVNKYWTFKHVS